MLAPPVKVDIVLLALLGLAWKGLSGKMDQSTPRWVPFVFSGSPLFFPSNCE